MQPVVIIAAIAIGAKVIFEALANPSAMVTAVAGLLWAILLGAVVYRGDGSGCRSRPAARREGFRAEQ